eukprot:56715-Chlamydomonas_euryale.AAC.2
MKQAAVLRRGGSRGPCAQTLNGARAGAPCTQTLSWVGALDPRARRPWHWHCHPQSRLQSLRQAGPPSA